MIFFLRHSVTILYSSDVGKVMVQKQLLQEAGDTLLVLQLKQQPGTPETCNFTSWLCSKLCFSWAR